MNYTTTMRDDEVKKNIYKCSRCALCQGVCPVYDEVKNENSTARGKLMQIWGLKKGELKLNRKILQSLDLCLNCEKCRLNCPSGVDTTGVFNAEKKLSFTGKILTSDFVFNLKMSALRLFSFFKKTPVYNKSSDILYFEGCISKELKNKLVIHGVKLENGNFKCCALPYLTKGRVDIYNEIAAFNESIIENARLVVFDCATCFSAVRNYPFKNPKNRSKLIFYTDIYKNFPLEAKKPAVVSYHMPCHMNSAGKKLTEVEEILKEIKNIKYKRLENPEYCCGFGGDFFIRHPKIALSLSFKKARDIIETNPDIVLTSCPTCLWSLRFSLFVYKIMHGLAKTPAAMDMAEFLNKHCMPYKSTDNSKNDPQNNYKDCAQKELVKM